MLASDEAPKPTLIHSMKNIMNLPMEDKYKWTVIAYALNKDIIDENGKVDPLRGMISPLGTYRTETEAVKKAEEVIEKTGHWAIKIIKYASFAEISTNPDQSIITNVYVDVNNKILKMENDEFEKQKELYEKRKLYEQEMMKECELECDVNHIEHYKRSAYLVTKHYLAYLELKNESEKMYKNYELRKKVLQEHLQHHPEHEAEFLPYFKNKLSERGELDLYQKIESGYNEYKEIFLN